MGLPEAVWTNYSLRQVLGFYDIHNRKKNEDLKINAALHGAELKDDGKSGRSSDARYKSEAISVTGKTEDNNKTVNIDLRCASEKDWKTARKMLGGGLK